MGKNTTSEELPRAFLHSTLTIALLFMVQIYGTYVLAALIIVDIAIETVSKFFKKAHRFFYYSPYSPLSYATREEEKTTHDVHAALSGLCGMAAVQMLFPQFLVPATLTLAFADPLARIIGIRFGKRRILKTRKTFIGSSTFLLIATAVLVLSGYSFSQALPIGLFASLLEIFSSSTKRYIIISQDNFLVPLGIAFGLWAFRGQPFFF